MLIQLALFMPGFVDYKNMNHLRVKSKKENAGGTCASAVGFLAHAGGEFATAPLHPLSKPYNVAT